MSGDQQGMMLVLTRQLLNKAFLFIRYSYLKMTTKPVAASAAAAIAAGDEAVQPLMGGEKDPSSAGGALPAKQLPNAASLGPNGHAQLATRSHSVEGKL